MRRGEQRIDEPDVLILGPVPPPFGGVSVHLSRLVPLLERAGLNVAVLNHFSSAEGPGVVGALKKNPLNYYHFPKKFRPRIVHYHHARWAHLVATALGKRSSDARYIVTLHAGQVANESPLTSKNALVSRITRWALSRFDTVIVVNPKIASALKRHLDKQRIEVLPAFVEAENDQLDTYEPEIEAFLNAGRVLVVSAYAIQFDGHHEVYGLDNAIEGFANVASTREDLRLAIFVARRPTRPKGRRYLASLERRLSDAGLRQRALIVFGLPLLPALRHNVIYVRPTRVDGDAVSVREAQAAGVPVIASNVVQRPPGVVLFQTGNVADLSDTLRAALDDSAPPRRPTRDETERPLINEFADQLIRLYHTELALQAGSGE